MSKRKKSSSRMPAFIDDDEELNFSTDKDTPKDASESDEAAWSPPMKKHRDTPEKRGTPEKKESKSSPKSSSDICDSYGLIDVKLHYTDADYQNLTNYGLFVRMVRPQVQEANPSIAQPKLAAIMEAKWREFREGNPLTKKRREEDEKKKSEKPKEEKKKKKDKGHKEEKKREKERKKEEERRRIEEEEELQQREKEAVIDSEPDEEELGEEEEDGEDVVQEEDSEDEVVQAPTKRGSKGRGGGAGRGGARKSGGLQIKLPMRGSATKKKSVYYESDEEVSTPKRGSKARRSRTPRMQDSEEEEEEVASSRRSGRASRKTKMPDYAADFSEEEAEEEAIEPAPKRARAKPKKVVQEVSEEEFEQEEEQDEDDDMEDEEEDSDEDISRRNKRKVQKKKPERESYNIPGERKSERSRRSVGAEVGAVGMSDRDFEKMIRRDEKEEEDKKSVKTKKKKKLKSETKKRREANTVKKEVFYEKQKKKEAGEEVEEDSGEESDHCFYCEICHDAGDLLLCDKCPRSWHKDCLKLEDKDIPEGDWVCPKCTGEMESEPEDTGHDTWCKICKDGGEVILCDTCVCVFHMNCCRPPLKEMPEGDWRCERCETLDIPLKGWVKNVITWKWSHQTGDELDHSPTKKLSVTDKLKAEADTDSKNSNDYDDIEKVDGRPVRHLFVRWKDWSYWECSWITELQLEMFHPITCQFFKKKFDLDEPPALEDGSSFGKRRKKHGDKAEDGEEEDPHHLEDKYFKYGIKPEYLQISHILNHDGNKLYLVKWKELDYAESTWENTKKIHPALQEDWDIKVALYWSRRKEHMKDEKRPKKDELKLKKKELRKKWEEQPEYFAKGMKLHPYQLEGLNWMRFSYSQETNIILADEMGLGKTIQAATFVYSLWKEGHCKGPFLFSVPLSTLLNWEREFRLWAPDMYVVTYIGSKEGRQLIREQEFSYKEGAFHSTQKAGRIRSGVRPKFDVLLTSYEYVNIDYATLHSIQWSMLCIDEAHRLKSQQSLFFKTLTQYKLDYILLLTGTPLQNNLEELFNLLNFLERSKFDDMDNFLGEFSDISKDEQVSRLHDMLAPHMLRRLKIDVFKDLPSKTELIVRVELSDMQKKYYKYILTKNFEALNVKGHHNQTSLMNIMMDLRKVCNHPYLFPAAEQEAPMAANGYFEVSALIKASGKLEILAKMLKVLREQKHRVLIFSQMTRVLDTLEDFLVGMQFRYERIDGSIMGKYRQDSIDRFNSSESDSFCFLLSTKAGGLGINLATADTVIIFDMDWNPHNDIQAFSRAHRIGQKNKVLIYRFVCRNTVEERMTQVCKQKMMLTELVIHRGMGTAQTALNPNEKAESITKKEVNDILKFGAEKLFKDDEEGKVVYDDAMILKLLDRDQEDDKAEEGAEGEGAGFGMNDYLRSFKVATYTTKVEEEEEDEKEEEPEEEEEEEEETKDVADEEDPEYWKRILGTEFDAYQAQMMREQEEYMASLGKGKRTRRKVNYGEALAQQKEWASKMGDADKDDADFKLSTKKLSKEEKRRLKEQAMQGPPEDDDEVDKDDVVYLSEYEPDSEDSVNSDSENEEEEDSEVEDTALPEALRKKNRDKIKIIEREKAHKKKVEEEKEKEKAKMPPLLAKISGQIEVLGFTPRQRRAFMDAVMRYGLPPEDCYKSQWLVRDLRRKPEKVFKAYVSLFLRHLCETIADDAEKFSDGIPREGLSRQHVLTRIGMMSLIRRKVHEFEKHNGTESFADFGIKIIVGGAKMDLVYNPKTAKDKDGKTEADRKAEAEKSEEKKENGDKAENNADGENGGEKKTGDKKEDDEEKEKDQEKDKETDKETDKDSKDGEDAEKKKEEEKTKTASGEEEDKKETPDVKEDIKGEETDEVKKENEKEASMETDEKQVDKDEEKSEEKEDKEDVKEEKSGDPETGEKAEEKMDVDKEEGDKDAEKEKDAESKDEKNEDKEKTDDKDETKEDKKETKEDKDGKDDKSGEKEVKKDEPEKTAVEKAIDERVSRQRRLRKKFYIADGGFTDLQNLWNYEENVMKDQKEWEVWHRHHDFWLLTGIVTHGYRHWQDILNDPRFDCLNRAFRNDSDKMRKGAFLNRRFQLLEQALVIEEQLRKELRENTSLLKLLPDKLPEDDQFLEIDQLADVLRKLIKDGHIPAGTDPVLIRILMQIENLVGDIRQATYSGMPSTIAKTPQQVQPRPQGGPVPGQYRGSPAGQAANVMQQYRSQQMGGRSSNSPNMGRPSPDPRKSIPSSVSGKQTPPMVKKKGGNVICID